MPETKEMPEELKEPAPVVEGAGGAKNVEELTEATRRAVDLLTRALAEAEAALTAAPSASSEQAASTIAAADEQPQPEAIPDPPEDAEEQAAAPQVENLLRALTARVDEAISNLADNRRILLEGTQAEARATREHLDSVLERMEKNRRVIIDQLSTLSQGLERLERRLDDVTSVAGGTNPPAVAGTPASTEEPVETEPTFQPTEGGLVLAISSVPGFQGLMEVQRALTRLPAVEGASVERYFDGEARIVIMLRDAITVKHLVETLTQATGQQLQIEESIPAAALSEPLMTGHPTDAAPEGTGQRLRVRFQGPVD